MTVSLKYKRNIRQLLHKSVSDWTALSSSSRLLVSENDVSRARNTFYVIYRYEKLCCRYTLKVYNNCCPFVVKQRATKRACINESFSFIRLRRWTHHRSQYHVKPLLSKETVNFLANEPRYRLSCRFNITQHRPWRIKAAWRPMPCWDHWLACRGWVCARSRIGIPSPRILGTPGSRIPGRNAATTYPWDAALSVLAPTIGNVPTSLLGTPGRNCSQPRRTTPPSSPPFPGLPGARPASRRRSDGIDDCVARVRSIYLYNVLWN